MVKGFSTLNSCCDDGRGGSRCLGGGQGLIGDLWSYGFGDRADACAHGHIGHRQRRDNHGRGGRIRAILGPTWMEMGFHTATSLDRGGERSGQQEGDVDKLHDESSGDEGLVGNVLEI